MTFEDFSVYTIIIPSLVGIWTLKTQNRTLIKLSVLILFTISLQIAAAHLANSGKNNMWLFHIHTWIETTILSLIFIDILTSWRRVMVQILLGAFLVFSIINLSLLESLVAFNANQRYFAGIIIIISILSFYFQLFKEAKIEKLERNPYFILSSSLLIYFTGTLFLFIFGNYVMTELTTNYWHLHSVFNLLLNIGYTLTLWMGVKKLT